MARGPKEKLLFYVTLENKDYLQDKADQYGMTLASLGSFIVGKWVEQQQREDALADGIRQDASKLLAKAVKRAQP